MPVSPARRLAYRVLRRVESGEVYAADCLRSAGTQLSPSDRHLATELVLGTLRRRAEIDAWIERLAGRQLRYFQPEVLVALRLGVYQIRHLSRVPKSAAVNESVELTRAARKGSATGLVNAVLRKCEPARGECGDEADAEAARLALPDWLRRRWADRFGREAALALGKWSLTPPAGVVRVAGGHEREDVRRALAAAGVQATPARFAPRGLVIERAGLWRSEKLRAGRLAVQEEASQIAGALLAPEPDQRVLDLCAAPGMKTAQAAEELGRGLIVACDLSARRLHGMARVLAGRLPGGVQWERVQLDAALPLPFITEFDRVLLDAPCSGTGTLARNPEIKWRLNLEDIARLAGAQQRMLTNGLALLAPRGRLVYATCSMEPEENEQVVEKVLAGKKRFRRLDRAELASQFPFAAPLFDDAGYFRTRPDLNGTDGFFAAVIVRHAE